MARTELSLSKLTTNARVDQPAGVAGNTDGHFVVDAVPEETVLRVVIATATTNVIVKAGVYPPALASGQGDLTFSCAIGSHLIGPFDSSRVLRGDGRMHVDYGTAANVTITALHAPRT